MKLELLKQEKFKSTAMGGTKKVRSVKVSLKKLEKSKIYPNLVNLLGDNLF